MKTLLFNGETYEAEKIIKTDSDIIGYDLDDNVVFSFKGISDFTLFQLEEGQHWDIKINLEQENVLLKAQNIELMLAVAELASVSETDKMETQLAIAELASIITGGVV